MATSNDIKKGLCIEFSNDIYKVIEFLHVKPGKGPAFVRTKLKSVTNGKVIDNTFSAGHKIDEVKVITRKFQYLYDDENGFHFMNNEDFSQMYLNKEMIENAQERLAAPQNQVRQRHAPPAAHRAHRRSAASRHESADPALPASPAARARSPVRKD